MHELHFRILEEKVWGEIWVFNNGRLKENPHQRIKSSQHLIFHYVCDAFFRCLIDSLALISIRIKGRRALEDQGVSISKIKRRGQIRWRIKRSHLPLVLETLANFLFSISNISKLESFNSLTCLRTSNKEDQRNIWREGKGIKTFAIEGVYCWRWHCCRLNTKYHQRWGSHRVGNVYNFGQSWHVKRLSQERLDWGLKLLLKLTLTSYSGVFWLWHDWGTLVIYY